MLAKKRENAIGRIFKITAFTLIFSGSVYSAFSQQKQITTQGLIWINYNSLIKFNHKWFLLTEFFERRFLQQFKHHHLLIRTHLHYKFHNSIDVGCGFTYSLQSDQYPTSTSKLVVPEYRPHIEVNYKKHFERISLNGRFRIENRYIQKSSNEKLIRGFSYTYRFRTYLGLEYPLFETKKDQKVKSKISLEYHFNHGKNIDFGTFDQNRFYVGLLFEASKQLSFEIGYLNWYQKKANIPEYFNRHITRISVYHTIWRDKHK